MQRRSGSGALPSEMKGAEAAVYNFENMKDQFSKADKSGNGIAGPAQNYELVLYEFLNVITRISF